MTLGGFRADLLDIEAQSKLIGANGLTHTAKSHALWIHAWVRRLLTGRSDDPVALDDLRAAIKTDRANLNAATDFVVLTCSRVRPPGSDLKTIANGVRAGPPALDGATRALVAEAHASVKNILACEHQGARRSQQSQLRNARHALVFVAWRGADAELAREAAKTALTHGHPAWKPIYEAVLMWAGE